MCTASKSSAETGGGTAVSGAPADIAKPEPAGTIFPIPGGTAFADSFGKTYPPAIDDDRMDDRMIAFLLASPEQNEQTGPEGSPVGANGPLASPGMSLDEGRAGDLKRRLGTLPPEKAAEALSLASFEEIAPLALDEIFGRKPDGDDVRGFGFRSADVQSAHDPPIFSHVENAHHDTAIGDR
jgi:hypothetical protein